jgi:hypothetical protein
LPSFSPWRISRTLLGLIGPMRFGTKLPFWIVGAAMMVRPGSEGSEEHREDPHVPRA